MSGKFPAVGPHQNFAANLLALCNRHGTIASVCRLLGINRQQFNKYLAGTNLPGPAILDGSRSFSACRRKRCSQLPPMGRLQRS